MEALPEGELVILRGYEFLDWIGDPEINWHVAVDFEATEVIAPKDLKIIDWKPWRQ